MKLFPHRWRKQKDSTLLVYLSQPRVISTNSQLFKDENHFMLFATVHSINALLSLDCGSLCNLAFLFARETSLPRSKKLNIGTRNICLIQIIFVKGTAQKLLSAQTVNTVFYKRQLFVILNTEVFPTLRRYVRPERALSRAGISQNEKNGIRLLSLSLRKATFKVRSNLIILFPGEAKTEQKWDRIKMLADTRSSPFSITWPSPRAATYASLPFFF